MLGISSSSSSRKLCKKLEIYLYQAHIFSSMSFVVDNMHYFQTKSSVHDINTRYKNQLHIPSVRLIVIEECTTYSAIKIFNKLPRRISGLNMFVKSALRKYLRTHLFSLKNFYQMISACLFLE